MKYVYPAIFTSEGNGVYSVQFYDLPNIVTQGNDLNNAIDMANDALCLMLYWEEKENRKLPEASELKDIKLDKGQFAQYVACDTEWYERYYETKAVRKNLTIPAYLALIAEQQNINFSAVLQEALAKKLGVAIR
jgi:predicted RNase H-like HicB family nuclease